MSRSPQRRKILAQIVVPGMAILGFYEKKLIESLRFVNRIPGARRRRRLSATEAGEGRVWLLCGGIGAA
jgi:hypothetical protein